MGASSQAGLFPAAPEGPEGLRYAPELISAGEEQALVAAIVALPFKPFEFHGYLGNRRVVSFGWRYDYSRQAIAPAEPIPDFLQPLRERVAAFAARPVQDFQQVLVTEYAPGAGIGWHRDKKAFGEVAGVSLVAPCTFRFRRKADHGWDRAAFRAEPRSAYILSGPARTDWEHSIPPLDALRYSVTLRTMAGR